MPEDAAGEVGHLNVAQGLAIAVTCSIFSAIWIIVRPRGLLVQVSTCSFVLSLVCTQLLMKELASSLKFRYPAIVTSLHFLSVWLVSWIFWAARGDFYRCHPASLGSGRRFVTFVLPIAASLPLSIVFNNTSLLYMGAGLAGVVGTLAPIITAILTHFLGRRISRHGWMGVLVATCGASFIAIGEAGDPGKEDSLVLFGLLFCTMSVFLRAVKAVLQDQLLEPAAYQSRVDLEQGKGPNGSAPAALTPMHVWALTAPPCTLLAFAYALSTESLTEAIHELTADPSEPTSSKAFFVLISCLSATILNILGLMSVKQLGASSMQIVGKLNTIVLLALSMGFWGESMPKD